MTNPVVTQMMPYTSPQISIPNDVEYTALSYSGTKVLYGYYYSNSVLVAHIFGSTRAFQPHGNLDTELRKDRALFSNAKTTKSKKKIHKLLMIQELLK